MVAVKASKLPSIVMMAGIPLGLKIVRPVPVENRMAPMKMKRIE